MKRFLLILMVFCIASNGLNLFADKAYSPVIIQAGTPLLSGPFPVNCFPGLYLTTYSLNQHTNLMTQTIFQTMIDTHDPGNWVVNQFNHGGLLASLMTFVTGLGLYIGGGAIASTDLDLALVLITIGVPVNSAGCLLADFFLQCIHNTYKARGAEINENLIPWSWLLSGVGVALFAGSIIVPFIIPDLTGNVISICLGGGALIVNILDFYLVKYTWLRQINAGILKKRLEYP